MSNQENQTEFKYIKVEEDNEETSKGKFQEINEWIKKTSEDKGINEKVDVIKENVSESYSKSKEKFKEFAEEKELKEKLVKGKDKAIEVGNDVVNIVSDGVKEVMNNEKVKDVVSSVSDSFDKFKNDERVKSGVSKAKKGTLNVATKAYNGIKKALEENQEDNNS